MLNLKNIDKTLRSRLSWIGHDILYLASNNIKKLNKNEFKKTDDIFDSTLDYAFDYVPTINSELESILKMKNMQKYIIEATDIAMEDAYRFHDMLSLAYSMFVEDDMMLSVVKIAKLIMLNYYQNVLKINELDAKELSALFSITQQTVEDNDYSFCYNDILDIIKDVEVKLCHSKSEKK